MSERPTRGQVRETYDTIGEHFAKTRANPWPEVVDFLEGTSGEIGLDIGCGNGRHAALLAGHTPRVVGLDASRELLRVAREDTRPEIEFLQGDAATLPLDEKTVDLAVYVATMHHLPDRATRRQSLDELARVLTVDGTALVSVWSTTHDKFDATEGFDTTVDWTLPGGETVPRFYHIYAPAEFEADLAASDLSVRDYYVSSGNCYAEVEGKRP